MDRKAEHDQHWYAVRTGKTGHYVGDRKQVTLWQIAKPQKSETGHGTGLDNPSESRQPPFHFGTVGRDRPARALEGVAAMPAILGKVREE